MGEEGLQQSKTVEPAYPRRIQIFDTPVTLLNMHLSQPKTKAATQQTCAAATDFYRLLEE